MTRRGRSLVAVGVLVAASGAMMISPHMRWRAQVVLLYLTGRIPDIGLKPLLVGFTDDSTGTITNRLWTFGDNSSTNTTDAALTHTYLSASTNTVTLTVTGPYGSNTFSRADYIVVTGNLLITAISVSGSDVIISFLSSASATYSLEYTDTSVPADWKTAVSPIPGNGGVVTVTQVGGATGNARFYRIRQLQ